MKDLNRDPREYIAAHSETIRELWFQDAYAQVSKWRRAKFEVHGHGQTAQTSDGEQGRPIRKQNRATA